MKLIVMAKEPIPGRVKTRLCPPCDHPQAAALAAAALADTLDAAMASGADEVVLALDGARGDWCPAGIRVVAQAEGSFDHRLAAAWGAVGGPAVQIGMDTPQVTPSMLDGAMERLVTPGTDAVLGDATDGGWWLIGLHRAEAAVFDGVPMSRDDTAVWQRRRLAELGHVVADVEPLTDVDDIDDAFAVAAAAPDTRFAAAMRSMFAS